MMERRKKEEKKKDQQKEENHTDETQEPGRVTEWKLLVAHRLDEDLLSDGLGDACCNLIFIC